MKVMLGIPAHRDFPAATVISLLETQWLCELIELVPCIVSDCSLGAFAARNLVAYEFMLTDCSHLFFIDSDMTWRASDFLKMLRAGYPFIAAAGPTKQDKPKLAIRGDRVGLCFACIERRVVEDLILLKPVLKFQGKQVPQIFACGVEDDKLIGEDIAFCEDLRALGYQINIDHSIQLGHIGQKEYRI